MSHSFMGEENLRRLPIYLLLDCSGSMEGEPIMAVNEGMSILYRELINNPRAVETAWICVITFAEEASKYPLVPIDQFQPPLLAAGGGTPMGGAFRALADSIETDLLPNTRGSKGDYAPIVFFLTDGEPTDAYEVQLARLRALQGNRSPTIIALGCGANVRTDVLHKVTDQVYVMHEITSERLRSFFRWVSGSIARVSVTIGNHGTASDVMPPPSIPGVDISHPS